MPRRIFIASIVLGAIAFLAMAVTTFIWMTVPVSIVYRESSLQRTDFFSIEVREHGRSYFVTPAQKRTLDRIHAGTPIIWFGSLAVAVAAILAGAAARLRM